MHARRRGGAAAAQHRHLHAADLVHRPAGGGRAGAARRRCRSACRSSPRRGARTWRCASRTRWSRQASRAGAAAAGIGRRRNGDRPARGRGRGARGLRALREGAGDQRRRDARRACSARTPRTIRYGVAENLYGHEEIAAFRAARSPVGLARTRSTHGDHHLRPRLRRRLHAVPPRRVAGKVGRQMQTWVRFAEGWRVVAAHVSLIDAPA